MIIKFNKINYCRYYRNARIFSVYCFFAKKMAVRYRELVVEQSLVENLCGLLG